MKHGLSAFIALPLVMAFLGCSSMSTTQKGAAIGGLEGAAAGGLVGSAVRPSGRGGSRWWCARSGEAVLLLETNSRATRKSSNNSKKILTGKTPR